MTQMRLNLNFPPQLMLYTTLQQLTLTQYLERYNVLCPAFTGEVDLSEFTPAERFADFEVVECPPGAGFGSVIFLIAFG